MYFDRCTAGNGKNPGLIGITSTDTVVTISLVLLLLLSWSKDITPENYEIFFILLYLESCPIVSILFHLPELRPHIAHRC